MNKERLAETKELFRAAVRVRIPFTDVGWTQGWREATRHSAPGHYALNFRLSLLCKLDWIAVHPLTLIALHPPFQNMGMSMTKGGMPRYVAMGVSQELFGVMAICSFLGAKAKNRFLLSAPNSRWMIEEEIEIKHQA